MKDIDEKLDINNITDSIQIHLSILQDIIQRMASNSASTKAWCISLVSAIFVLVTEKSNPDYVFISIFPIFVFWTLDVYYLAYEKAFRNTYNSFIKKIHSKEIYISDLYSVKPEGEITKLQYQSIISFSTWGFYLLLIVLTILIRAVLL